MHDAENSDRRKPHLTEPPRTYWPQRSGGFATDRPWQPPVSVTPAEGRLKREARHDRPMQGRLRSKHRHT
jgi:hypothetical protein